MIISTKVRCARTPCAGDFAFTSLWFAGIVCSRPMKKLIILLTLSAAWAVQAQTTNAPRTWFESYKSTLETPLVMGMSRVGALSGQVGYPVDLRVERLNLRGTTNMIYAVAVRTRLGRNVSQVDYIDYDELDGLIRGFRLISEAGPSIVPMDDFEVAYRVRSGLSVAKFSNGNNMVIAIRCGDANSTRNQIAPDVLENLQALLAAAKSKIEAIAGSGQ